jgi:DNA-binding transcriptional ArsR family regulator
MAEAVCPGTPSPRVQMPMLAVVLVVAVVLVRVGVVLVAVLTGHGTFRAAGGGPVSSSGEYVLMYARDNVAPAGDGQQLPMPAQIEVAVTALRMLADPTRLRLLWLLREGEHDVGSLAAVVGAARPAVSQHLGKLLLAGLVGSRREGRRVLYRARGGHVRRLVAEALQAADHHLTGDPEHD